MAKKKVTIAVAAALLGAGVVAHAQVSPVRPAYVFPSAPPATGATSVQMGDTPLFLTPYIGFAGGYDDNLFLTNGNEKTSTLYITSPGFKIDARDATQVIQASYQAQFGRYGQSEDDDYIDQQARAQYDLAITRSNFLRLGYDYARGHDPRGSTDRSVSTHPDKYRLSTPYVNYAFGAPGAQGRAEAFYSNASRRYLNNRNTTFASDHDTQDLGGAFYWRVMPRTSALVEVRRTDQSYLDPASLSNSREDRYYIGATWEATAATSGTLKVGRLQKRFDSDNPKYSGTGWEAMITWLPRTYSKFDFFTARNPVESTGEGTFILSDVYGVNWSHAWSSVVTTDLLARYQKDDYQGFPRQDKTAVFGAKVGYKFRRWLTLGAEYTHTNRNSNSPLNEYDKNLYLLTATASM
jgi:hypothetical protein